MKKVLHVGCGLEPIDRIFKDYEEIRLDIDTNVCPDIVNSITDMKDVENGSFDAVFSSHNIEHLYFHEVSLALNEFNRVLRSGGIVYISCPNLKEVAKYIATDRLEDVLYVAAGGSVTSLDVVFGHTGFVASGNEFMQHKCGFTAKSLYSKLKQVGFIDIKVTEDVFNLNAIATKEGLQ